MREPTNERCDDAQNARARDSNKVKAGEVQNRQLRKSFSRFSSGDSARSRMGQGNGIRHGQHASASLVYLRLKGRPFKCPIIQSHQTPV